MGNKKKVFIISNFYEELEISRPHISFKYFKEREFDVKVLHSSYSHSFRKYREITNPDCVAIKTIAYSKSFSLKRIMSNFIFAWNLYKYLKNNKADIYLVSVPTTISAIAVILGRNKNSRLIFDVLDLWPESLPVNGRLKKLLLGKITFFFGKLRSFVLSSSDFIIYECNLFKEFLKLNKASEIIHLKKPLSIIPKLDILNEELTIGYLGNMGIINDLDNLLTIINEVSKHRKVSLVIIGDGPSKEKFIKNLKTHQINYKDYGVVTLEEEKYKILSSCWFGYNGYVSSPKIGLTYKSVDFLSYGIPILNTIKYDTKYLIESSKAGIHFENENIQTLIEILIKISKKDVYHYKKAAFRLFNEKFSYQSYVEEMTNVLNKLND